MDNIKIVEAYWVEGDLVEVPSEEGRDAYPIIEVHAVTASGKVFALHHYWAPVVTDGEDGQIFVDIEAGKAAAARLAARIQAVGLINPDRWSYVPSYANGEVSDWDLMDDQERANRYAI